MPTRVFLILFILLVSLNTTASAQDYVLSGKVVDINQQAIEFAVVQIKESEQYSITDQKGQFAIDKVQAGLITLKISIIGFDTKEIELDLKSSITDLTISLEESNLALSEVVVTAEPVDEPTTSYKISSSALEHEQVWDITQIQSFLPGGKTTSSTGLTSTQRLYLQSQSASESGNPTFGTAIEIDGIRIQNNADLDSYNPYGSDTRNISTTNIESIEVTTGIASVENGDLSNGIVKINTKKGPTPLSLSIAINPNTKQYGAYKGFNLGEKWGVLNVSGEITKSISNLMSPYTTYDRNSLSLTHEKYFKNKLILTSAFSFNIGGYDSESDPDLYTGTYTKVKDNAIRGRIGAKYLLNKSWISNLEFSSSVNYTDKLAEYTTRESAAATLAANHATDQGYFIATDYDENPDAPIILLPTGYWYEKSYDDSKLLDLTAKVKANLIRSFSNYTNKLMIGADYTNSGNLGQGFYYDDMRYAPTWRPYVYKEVPHINNAALYLEDKLTKNISDYSKLTLVAGLRSDNVFIDQTEYGWMNTISPRFNLQYEQKNNSTSTVKDFNIYAGWGQSSKLPSLGVLNPTPSYSSDLAFTPGSTSDNVAYYAYYNQPATTLYNPDLKFQTNNKFEVGIGMNIKGTRVKVSAFHSKVTNPYIYETVYSPYSYNKTTQEALENSVIPIDDRWYTIDQNTGIVTVHDESNTYSSYDLDYTTKNDFIGRRRYTNGSSSTRMGLDWIIDFAKVKAINTSLRIDGNFYYYKGVEETIMASTSSMLMANGEPYSYIGYYVGGASSANGSLSKQVNANFTFKTHIPKIRLIVTLKIETSLYNYSQTLSEYSNGDRGFLIENQSDYTGTDTDIYNKSSYVAVYPLYYTTWDDMNTKIPFKENYLWAKDNDPELYNELSRLVEKTSYKNYFNSNKISAYYSANINITKEIGDIASVTFFARNFTQNLGFATSTKNESELSLYNSYIPDYYYGISTKFKF